MIFRSGLLLSFCAVLLQIAVFLQPLLPEHYQISPVCETITRALLLPSTQLVNAQNEHATQHQHAAHGSHANQHLSHGEHAHQSVSHEQHDHNIFDQQQAASTTHNHHDANHQCQYCTVYANLVLPPELGIKEVFERIQVRLIFFKRQLVHVYFVLQRLFLIPQGRAPPVLV